MLLLPLLLLSTAMCAPLHSSCHTHSLLWLQMTSMWNNNCTNIDNNNNNSDGDDNIKETTHAIPDKIKCSILSTWSMFAEKSQKGNISLTMNRSKRPFPYSNIPRYCQILAVVSSIKLAHLFSSLLMFSFIINTHSLTTTIIGPNTHYTVVWIGSLLQFYDPLHQKTKTQQMQKKKKTQTLYSLSSPSSVAHFSDTNNGRFARKEQQCCWGYHSCNPWV